MNTVYIGHAVGDENGRASGGEAGNQNGRELRTQAWYLNPKGWVVLRPKSPEVAKKIAYDAKAAGCLPKRRSSRLLGNLV